MVDKKIYINIRDNLFAFRFKCLLSIHPMTRTDTFGNSINQLLQSYNKTWFRCLRTTEQERLWALQKEVKQEVFGSTTFQLKFLTTWIRVPVGSLVD